MNRNAISRLLEVSLLAGIALSLVGAGSVFAQEKDRVVTPGTANLQVTSAGRVKLATQKRMRNPWEKTIQVASTQPRTGE